MRTNSLKEKLASDEPVFGPMIMEAASPGLPQIFAAAGADFVMYDMEAGCLDIATIKMQIALTRGLPVVPLVNVPWHDYSLLARPLDCGAMGLLVPVVQTRSEAEAIARITHYPPVGVRGVAFGIAHDDYSAGDFVHRPSRGGLDEHIRLADSRTLVMVKVETAKGVENVDEIIAVPGIDVAFIGHLDLSVSLGIPGQYDHPHFLAAVDRVIATCRKYGKTGGCLVTTPDAARSWIAKGFRLIVYSTDVILLGSGFQAGVAAIRQTR